MRSPWLWRPSCGARAEPTPDAVHVAQSPPIAKWVNRASNPNRLADLGPRGVEAAGSTACTAPHPRSRGTRARRAPPARAGPARGRGGRAGRRRAPRAPPGCGRRMPVSTPVSSAIPLGRDRPVRRESASSTSRRGVDRRRPRWRSAARPRPSATSRSDAGRAVIAPRSVTTIAPALHRSSIAPEVPDRHRHRPGATNIPTITKPSMFRSIDSTHARTGPLRARRATSAGQLHRPDDQRDDHREARDGHVVVDLAHRARERPPVGEVHERPVERVEQRHAGGEQDRQAEDRGERQAGAGRARGQEEQRHLARGVEPEPEQEADRVHLPRPRDRPCEAAEDRLISRARSAGAPARPRRTPPAHLAEGAHDPDEDRRG